MDAVRLLRLLARELADSSHLPAIDVIEDDERPSLAIMASDGTRFFLVVDEQMTPFGVFR